MPTRPVPPATPKTSPVTEKQRLEKAAKAAYAIVRPLSGVNAPPWEGLAKQWQEVWRRAARAAIKAFGQD